MPAAWSWIADYFSRPRLPRAMSFFLLVPYLGGGLALLLGGTVVQALGNPNGNGGINGLEPWRAAFLVAGCIGVVPALLLFFIREPASPIVAAASVATSFRSEEHTSELQSLMRISYADFCLKKKNRTNQTTSSLLQKTQHHPKLITN